MSGQGSCGIPHRRVVLFYKYFPSCHGSASALLHLRPDLYMPVLQKHQHDLCASLGMRGRILIAPEGINGTLSAADDEMMTKYINAMECFNLIAELGNSGLPPQDAELTGDHRSDDGNGSAEFLFSGVDWKVSEVDDQTASLHREPFPDLKISVVSEIVSTGGAVGVSEIPQYGGIHLSPKEFHEELVKGGWVGGEGGTSDEAKEERKEVVLIDVRNTFEHAVGHFVDPKTGRAAIDPNMTTFASFDTNFCARNAEYLRDKKVLMYCTGGIRCEKASAMLRKRGVDDVSQLSGGIHRYLETFGDSGLFKGKNFVFDQRVALEPLPPGLRNDEDCADAEGKGENRGNICVGRCLECSSPFDEISGSRLCTVCRDLVLICPECQGKLREYHCKRHSSWKDCYFTFLEVFDKTELTRQAERLKEIRDSLKPPSEYKNMRRTLMRQIAKVLERIKRLQAGDAQVESQAPRRCRTCMETEEICDGLCWGFWKQSNATLDRMAGGTMQPDNDEDMEEGAFQPVAISAGNIVEPGPDWNELRHGPKQDSGGTLKRGRVVEIKPWGSGGNTEDCVAIIWDNDKNNTHVNGAAQPKIYRWGVVAKNEKRLYDVQLVGPMQ